ncbi:CD209 antigen-like protein C [Crotalus tigris]|uniref:CD209 antigen-like protein C n=1 Tax=Crotalus tigris TaxID=88082 RepID=UPI00192FA243|nr:CD209 antigen-like protein C [Crotalus tigris]XP_039198444.1 CD209 antigen-like protein C [Crotalus tigris]
MAPKPPAGKAPAKGPAGPAKPGRTPTKIEECLAGYNCATLGILMLFCLFLYTVWYISLCAVERAKRDPLRQAVAQIRQYMISRNAEYDALNDTEVLLEAEKVARQLVPWAQKINELQTEIAELHYKLNHDWTAYKGHLYLFNYASLSFEGTVELCNKSKAYITDVTDDTEQRFLEESIKMKHGHYWIGLSYINREWKWVALETKPQKEYWREGHPGKSPDNKCVRMDTECNTRLQCWGAVECTLRGRGICKQKPETKWIN